MKSFMFSLPYNKQMPKDEQITEKKILCEFLITLRVRNSQYKMTFSLKVVTEDLPSSICIWITISDALSTE